MSRIGKLLMTNNSPSKITIEVKYFKGKPIPKLIITIKVIILVFYYYSKFLLININSYKKYLFLVLTAVADIFLITS